MYVDQGSITVGMGQMSARTLLGAQAAMVSDVATVVLDDVSAALDVQLSWWEQNSYGGKQCVRQIVQTLKFLSCCHSSYQCSVNVDPPVLMLDQG